MMRTAVLGIDLQKGLFHSDPEPFDVISVTKNIRELLTQARKNRYEVIMIQHQESEKDGNLIPATEPWMICDEFLSVDSETVVHKEHADAFMDTDLDLVLKADNIDHLIICGMESDQCVSSTAQSALKRGFKVTLAQDGHAQGHSVGEKGKKVINEVNQDLMKKGVQVQSTSQLVKNLNDGTFA